MNYITFIKILISAILALITTTVFLLMAAAGETVVAWITAVGGVMLLVWLWGKDGEK